MVQLCDTLTLDKSARICADGSLVAEVFAARTGLQDYRGVEVDPDNVHGMRDKAIARVYRPESEVFKADSLATFTAAPVTINHPASPVTADNWRGLGVGEINGDIVRDGDRVRVPIIIRDAAAVKASTTTHKQLSMGYAVNLVFPQDGKHPDGTPCDAYQTDIKINHIALVPAARGGPELRVVDERPTQKEPVMAGTITIDGLPVSLADEAAVRAVIAKKDAAITASETALADAGAKLSEATGAIAALEKQLADAKADLDPAKLDARVADRAALIASAKAVLPTVATDGKTDVEIRRAVVAAKFGDEAASMDDVAVGGAFRAFAKTDAAKVENIAPARAVNDAAADLATARSQRNAALATAYRA